MEKTWKWISNHRNKGLTYFGFGILAPFPGSSLYEYALKNEIFMQSNVDYNRIASSRDVNSIYLLDTAVSKKELHSFITKGVQLLWVEEQINTRNLRGILTPTFLKVSLNQPKAIIGILSK
jgi:CTP synthase (UTP-ammonia lyase)